MKIWEQNIDEFIILTNKHKVKMIMVGGGAVNFHGYQRHSADVDFWIETSEENFQNLIKVFTEMGYEIEDFPLKVKNKEQNISIKFSPLDLELKTNFSVNKTFEEAYKDSEEIIIDAKELLFWRILNLNDLIVSKLKENRPKDLLDIQQLKEINKKQ